MAKVAEPRLICEVDSAVGVHNTLTLFTSKRLVRHDRHTTNGFQGRVERSEGSSDTRCLDSTGWPDIPREADARLRFTLEETVAQTTTATTRHLSLSLSFSLLLYFPYANYPKPKLN